MELDIDVTFGPLAPLMRDSTIEEVWINSPERVFVARGGKSELTNLVLTFSDVKQLVDRILMWSGRRIDLSSPFVDAQLPDGSRLHVVIPEITAEHWCINIRKHLHRSLGLSDLAGRGMMSPEISSLLSRCVKSGMNILVSGGTQSGKTTLLNRILTEQHGKRIAVIENEFGEVGVDNDLVIGAEEEIFEMNNGCICCTVRGDLIRIRGNLMRRRDRFDHIVIETTGLADPAPVAQTFFVEQEIGEYFLLDAIITVVDAKHAMQQLVDNHEAEEQVGFADRILLSKTDLITPEEISALETRLRAINARAPIAKVHFGETDIEEILDIRGFNLNAILEMFI
jgi:Ni2+-binding GTPase involved in maturation of urease and hydrogenase